MAALDIHPDDVAGMQAAARDIQMARYAAAGLPGIRRSCLIAILFCVSSSR
jgi:hypothetical protein